MKTTLSIITVALVASVFTINPVSSEVKLENYSAQMLELNKVEKELKQIEKEVDSKIVNKALSYKKEITELQKENNSLRKNVISRVDTVYVIDTIVIKEKKSFWGKLKTDTIK